MSKTNFTKVEKALEEGMIKIKSQQLLNEADALTSKKTDQESSKIPSKEICNAILMTLDRDLKKMHTQDESLYKTLAFNRIDLKKMISNPSLLTPQDWKLVKEIRERIDTYKKELAARLPIQSNQDLVDHEIAKHLNKRFNVNDRWIPLDKSAGSP